MRYIYSNTADEWISNVILNDINNSSGSTHYTDFTSLSTDVLPGSSYNIEVEITVLGGYTEHCIAFFDWNQDCDFNDTGESIRFGTGFGRDLNSIDNIPAGATLGSTLMRVSMHSTENPAACDEAVMVKRRIIPLMYYQDITLGLTALLEGPFNGVNMDANLGSLIPLNQPFNTAPWNYNGSESVGAMPNGNVVEWVLVDLRDAATAATATAATSIGKQAAFILTDGSIVDLMVVPILHFL